MNIKTINKWIFLSIICLVVSPISPDGRGRGFGPQRKYSNKDDAPRAGGRYARRGSRRRRSKTQDMGARRVYVKNFSLFAMAIKNNDFKEAQNIINTAKRTPNIALEDISAWQNILNLAIQVAKPKPPIETEEQAKDRRERFQAALKAMEEDEQIEKEELEEDEQENQ